MDQPSHSGHKRPYSNADRVLFLLQEILKQAGWEVQIPSREQSASADLVIANGAVRYLVEVKSVSDGKRARILPLLSMAILQARAAAQRSPGLMALAVIVGPRIEESLAEEAWRFAAHHAPDVAVGLLDFEGLRRFWGLGLENLNSERPPELQEKAFRSSESVSHLFSDLNQWLLKVLLGKNLPEDLINVPRHEFRNASQLADAAGVSVMSAFRFVRQLESEGFLNVASYSLRIANVERLLNQWQAAMFRPQREISFRWIIRGAGEDRFLNAVKAYQDFIDRSSGDQESKDEWSRQRKSRLCLGGFLAASWLGFGHVSGVPPLLYVERIDSDLLKKLGVARIEDDRPADVFVGIPAFKQSLFRAAVRRNGIQVSDILQVWLEASVNPARGAEQASLIKRKVLDRIIEQNL